MRKKIEDLKSNELWQLHEEWINGQPNTFGFAKESVEEFFAGYFDYLHELAEWDNPGLTYEQLEPYMELEDNEDNLFDYYWNRQDYADWFEYSPAWTPEEEEAYCDYWNGI